MSFKDKHALKDLPSQIARLEAEITALQKQLDDQSAYSRDPARFAELATRLGTAQSELGVMEDRWIELEMLRQEFEG